jgi:hypothetical protein
MPSTLINPIAIESLIDTIMMTYYIWAPVWCKIVFCAVFKYPKNAWEVGRLTCWDSRTQNVGYESWWNSSNIRWITVIPGWRDWFQSIKECSRSSFN